MKINLNPNNFLNGKIEGNHYWHDPKEDVDIVVSLKSGETIYINEIYTNSGGSGTEIIVKKNGREIYQDLKWNGGGAWQAGQDKPHDFHNPTLAQSIKSYCGVMIAI